MENVVSMFDRHGQSAGDDRHEAEIQAVFDDQPALTAWLAQHIKDVRGTPVAARKIACYLAEVFEDRADVRVVTNADIEAMEFVLHADVETARDRMREVVELDIPDITDKLVALNLRIGWGNSDGKHDPDAELSDTTDLRQLEQLATFFLCACAVLLDVDFDASRAA